MDNNIVENPLEMFRLEGDVLLWNITRGRNHPGQPVGEKVTINGVKHDRDEILALFLPTPSPEEVLPVVDFAPIEPEPITVMELAAELPIEELEAPLPEEEIEAEEPNLECLQPGDELHYVLEFEPQKGIVKEGDLYCVYVEHRGISNLYGRYPNYMDALIIRDTILGRLAG